MILSMLHEGFGVFITEMLAARAARLMSRGGGAREIKVLWALGVMVVNCSGQGVIGRSWPT